jgi:hypothetical protein
MIDDGENEVYASAINYWERNVYASGRDLESASGGCVSGVCETTRVSFEAVVGDACTDELVGEGEMRNSCTNVSTPIMSGSHLLGGGRYYYYEGSKTHVVGGIDSSIAIAGRFTRLLDGGPNLLAGINETHLSVIDGWNGNISAIYEVPVGGEPILPSPIVMRGCIVSGSACSETDVCCSEATDVGIGFSGHATAGPYLVSVRPSAIGTTTIQGNRVKAKGAGKNKINNKGY